MPLNGGGRNCGDTFTSEDIKVGQQPQKARERRQTDSCSDCAAGTKHLDSDLGPLEQWREYIRMVLCSWCILLQQPKETDLEVLYKSLLSSLTFMIWATLGSGLTKERGQINIHNISIIIILMCIELFMLHFTFFFFKPSLGS